MNKKTDNGKHNFLADVGYWRQRTDEGLGDPPTKVDPGTFSGQR